MLNIESVTCETGKVRFYNLLYSIGMFSCFLGTEINSIEMYSPTSITTKYENNDHFYHVPCLHLLL